MKRRVFLHRLASTSVIGGTSAWASDSSVTKSETDAIRKIADTFLHEHGIRGLSIAYGRDGKIAFEHGYGFADAEGKEAVTPEHRFRIASISKPITATAVMMAAEKGLLKLGDKVFGSQGVLGSQDEAGLADITIEHLLTHTSGGWPNDKDDPMFKNPAMSHEELIAWTLANQKPTHKPGEHYAYSNFGYCLLGRALEKITGQPYEAHIQQMLVKCGITGMEISGNTWAERLPNEVIYHTDKPEAAYRMNVARMDAHGGWIATAGDLVRFASHLPILLNEASIRSMTTPTPAEKNYARGWAVNSVPNWWHSGSLPGTSTIMVHTARGLCWAGLLNGRTEGIGGALDKLMWQIGRQVKMWAL